MDAHQRRRQLLGEHVARLRVLGVAQEPARDGLAGDEVHDEGRAEALALVRAPAHPWHRDARGRRRLEKQELAGATRLDHVARRIAPQDQRLATAAPGATP